MYQGLSRNEVQDIVAQERTYSSENSNNVHLHSQRAAITSCIGLGFSWMTRLLVEVALTQDGHQIAQAHCREQHLGGMFGNLQGDPTIRWLPIPRLWAKVKCLQEGWHRPEHKS